jgi:hypothetical protein
MVADYSLILSDKSHSHFFNCGKSILIDWSIIVDLSIWNCFPLIVFCIGQNALATINTFCLKQFLLFFLCWAICICYNQDTLFEKNCVLFNGGGQNSFAIFNHSFFTFISTGHLTNFLFSTLVTDHPAHPAIKYTCECSY